MGTKLTDTVVRGLPAPEKGRRITYDSQVSGFGARVTTQGARAFVLTYRFNRRQYQFTIGQFPAWTATKARERAGALKREIDVGINPVEQRKSGREAPTIAELCDDWLSRPVVRAKRTVGEDRRKIDKDIKPALGDRKVAEIRARHIEDLMHTKRHRPYAANRTHALLSTLFSHAIREGWREDNPCKGVAKFQEERRQRYLGIQELQRLLEALADKERASLAEAAAANVVRLLLLTGARRGEVLKATWDQFDLENGEWVKPSSHTKQKKVHRVQLSPPAIEILHGMKERAQEEFLFPGPKEGQPLLDIKRFWATACRKAGLENVRLHDLRHTHASILASSGFSLPIIGQLLGHTQMVTTERYAHLYDDPLRQATARVGAVYEALADGKAPAEVVPLRSA